MINSITFYLKHCIALTARYFYPAVPPPPTPSLTQPLYIMTGQVLVSLAGYEAGEVGDMVAFLYGRLPGDQQLPDHVFADLQLGSFR